MSSRSDLHTALRSQHHKLIGKTNANMKIMIYVVLWTLVIIAVTCDQNTEIRRRAKRGWLAVTTGPKPPGKTCAFNPCSVPNFCGIGRQCVIDKNCISRCNCETESVHKDCVTATSSPVSGNKATNLTTTTVSLICTFNPCKYGLACDGGRKCSLNNVCRKVCECTDTSTHESCGSKNVTITTTTEETPVDDECENINLGCVHGKCVKTEQSFSCQCEDDWRGLLCDKDSKTCSRQCNEGHRCSLYGSVVEVCVPEESTTGYPISSAGLSSSNVCNDDYIPHSASENTCRKGLVCGFGLCLEKEDDVFTCACDPGASGPLCSKCCLHCGDNGECFNSEDGEVCNCHLNYTGHNCTELKPTVVPPSESPFVEATWYLWVVGVCAVVMVILIVVLVVAPYFLWRHRVVMVMKIVHYFQNYEDDDDREWDVFVSYRSTQKDEDFVVHTLMPKLEQELGFRLHLHFRDFIPGETIANNIIRAVQGSRRTILVITPQYIKSEFTKFEYQMAQQEMLKRKHRMLPILLDDISDSKETMDPHLKTILDSVTYLEWPKDNVPKKMDKFWKRVELSLPKKRHPIEAGQVDTIGHLNNNSSKLDDIKFSIVSENDKTILERSMNDYTTIDDAKLNAEEVYDTINDDELDRTKDTAKQWEINTTGDNETSVQNDSKDNEINV